MASIITPPYDKVGDAKKNTVVILGSSNGAGVGASTYTGDPNAGNNWSSPSTSWAGLLQSALGSSWNVVNRSLSGTGFVAAVNRFWTDVAPHNPTHVILCNHPINDGYNQLQIYQAHLKLISYCERIGAIPILRGAYPDNNMTSVQYQSMLGLNYQLDNLPVNRIDNFSEFDAGNGHWVGGSTYTADGLHPNDVGYAKFFSHIDLGLFYFGGKHRPVIRRGGIWTPSNNPSNGPGIALVNISGPVTSCTMRGRFNALSVSAIAARVFLSASRSANLRVRNPSNVYSLADVGALGDSTIMTNVVGWHDVCMVYNSATNIATLYVDGVSVVVVTDDNPTQSELFNNFVFAGRPDTGDAGPYSYAMSDFAMWRVPLTSNAVAKLYTGDVPPASLVYYSDMSNTPPTGGTSAMIANQINNGVYALAPAYSLQRTNGILLG